MAELLRNRTIKCACGKTLSRRNIRSSGMAVCRCGNNFTAAQFSVFRAEESAAGKGYCWYRWDADLYKYTTCDQDDFGATYGIIH